MTPPTKDLSPIRATPHFDTFIEPSTEIYVDQISVMSKSAASAFWHTHIDDAATNYFGLSDSSWIVLHPKQRLGNWMDAYNRQEYGSVTDLLERLPLEAQCEIAFCANVSTVLVASWKTFCQAWFGFIAISDESPIVLPRARNRQHGFAVIFTPRGAIWHLGTVDG